VTLAAGRTFSGTVSIFTLIHLLTSFIAQRLASRTLTPAS
jgi:hypothetical protein